MPELPEVETVRRGLAPFLTGALIEKVVLNRADLRFAFPQGFARGLEGRSITGVNRRAKYLLIGLSDEATWLAHLGMTGSFSIGAATLVPGSLYRSAEAGADADKHRHMVMSLSHPEHGALALSYSDPRRFGYMDLIAPDAPNPHTAPLGPEPLGNALDADTLGAALARRKTPIKAALLDQRTVAGLGNIYVCEALHRAQILPTRLSASLTENEITALVRSIRAVLEAAIAAGGSTLRDFKGAEGKPGYFQHAFDVYDREGQPCPREGCTGTVEWIVQSGRSSFFCPVCQH